MFFCLNIIESGQQADRTLQNLQRHIRVDFGGAFEHSHLFALHRVQIFFLSRGNTLFVTQLPKVFDQEGMQSI